MFEKIKCSLCGEEAVCHVTLIKDWQIIHKHYCSEHAKSVGLNEPKSFAFLDTGIVSIAPASNLSSKQCPQCHYTFKNFESTGLLGCKECFSTFKEFVDPILERLQHEVIHRGKVPLKALNLTLMTRQINELTKEMNIAIKEELYEAAAGVRDQIKTLQEKIQNLQKLNSSLKNLKQ